MRADGYPVSYASESVDAARASVEATYYIR